MSRILRALAPALAGGAFVLNVSAISFDDVQLWTGSGTNRAALVIEWSVPESLSNSTVPVPLADKTMVWGYRFNGSNAVATQMIESILAADPRLYLVVDDTFGTFVEGIGYNLSATGNISLGDGSAIYSITNGLLLDSAINVDTSYPINSTDLYWGGYFGPNWEVWNEQGDLGGFYSSPNRGTNEYWTPTDTNFFSAGYHGQWDFAGAGLDGLPLSDGSWIGLSVAAGEYEGDPEAPYNQHKHAPPSPDGTYAAYVYNSNDFAVQIVSTNDVDTNSPYNDPTAMLGRPTLNFLDGLGTGGVERTKIIEPPYWTDPSGSNDVITEISTNGEITLYMGRPIYDDPHNPYGIDFIVYGNSFYSATGTHGFVSDATDLNAAKLGSGFFGHSTTVSVSPDGISWFTYTNTPALIPDEAYRWDDTNDSWTDEVMNPTKPVNPSVITNNFSGQSVASVLDQFGGASGGTGYDLAGSGFSWIQYIRIQPGPGTYTVIDAIAAINPVVVGDAQIITPDNLSGGVTNLFFQNPGNAGQSLVTIGFATLEGAARISAVSLSDFSSFAPVPGNVSSAYKIAEMPVTGTNCPSFAANLALQTGAGYTGNGGDLRLYQWSGTNWCSQPFTFGGGQVLLAGITNLSACVVSQIIPPQLAIQAVTEGFSCTFEPTPNCPHTLQRSQDFVNWTDVALLPPTNALTVTLLDTNAPSGQAFYRLLVGIP